MTDGAGAAGRRRRRQRRRPVERKGERAATLRIERARRSRGREGASERASAAGLGLEPRNGRAERALPSPPLPPPGRAERASGASSPPSLLPLLLPPPRPALPRGCATEGRKRPAAAAAAAALRWNEPYLLSITWLPV